MGVEHDVPATVPSWPPSKITTFSPCAATSGNPRPLYMTNVSNETALCKSPTVLNNPALVLPRAARYPETADAWYEGRAKMLENPPEEKLAEVSGTPVVAPT